jgi:Transmembrane domain of unknown function (DUF3566)
MLWSALGRPAVRSLVTVTEERAPFRREAPPTLGPVNSTDRAGGTVVPEAESVTPATAEVAADSANGPSANGPSANGPSPNGNGAVRTAPRLSSPRPRRTTLNGSVPAPERGSASSRGSSSSLISKPQPTPPPVEIPGDDGRAAAEAQDGVTAAPAEAVLAPETKVADAVPVTEPSPLPVVVPTAPAKRGSQVPEYPRATVLPPTLPAEPPPVTTSMSTHRVAPVPRLVGRRPRVRKVTRVVRHVDPWSVFKVAIVFNLVLYGVLLTSGVLLWNVAHSTGTIDNLERFFESFGWSEFEFNGGEIFHSAWVAGLFAVVGLTGAAVLGATLFNLITDLVGGVRLTVLEEEVVERTASPMRRFVVRRPTGEGSTNLDEPRPPSTKLPTRTAAFEDPFGDGGPG